MMPLPPILRQLSLPIMGAPMFIVSYPELVIAQCQAGIIGAFPALNARSSEQLDAWLKAIKQTLQAYQIAHADRLIGALAVNQIVHPSNKRVEHDLEICIQHQVPILITSLSAPPHAVIDAVHAYGGMVLHDVTTIRHAHKALDAGVDGLILVAAGAGGHAGALSPFALVGEIRRFFPGPLVLAGAITDGRAILAAQIIGADLVYIGTRFIATQEAHAAPAYRQAIIDAAAADIVYTDAITGVHGNYLRSSVQAAGYDLDHLTAKNAKQPNELGAKLEQAKAWKDIWSAGQGVGMIDTIPTVADLVAELKQQYQTARQHVVAPSEDLCIWSAQ